MMERAVTDLPEPDSPTTPMTFLRGILKLIPSMALMEPASVMKETLRSLISARLPLSISLIGSLPFLGAPCGGHE